MHAPVTIFVMENSAFTQKETTNGKQNLDEIIPSESTANPSTRRSDDEVNGEFQQVINITNMINNMLITVKSLILALSNFFIFLDILNKIVYIKTYIVFFRSTKIGLHKNQ